MDLVSGEDGRRSANAGAHESAWTEMERSDAAEQELADGPRAERRGDFAEAAANLAVAAEEGVALNLPTPAPAGSRPLPRPQPAAPDEPARAAGRGLGSAASADLGLTRRLKALACTAPLHELDYHKAKLDWVDATEYHMAEIAIHTIDQVTIAMDFDTGAAHEAVQERVMPFVAAQSPDRTPDEHRRVARWVLEKLINVGTVDRVFRHDYGEIDVDGRYQRRVFDFKLICEVPGAAGEIYLRATDEAINVLVGALDTDVRSAQVAAEVKLENLINRGQLADARVAAEQARYRTVQYGELLRQKLEATRRDVRVVDWDTELPEMLDAALEHIEQRFKVEHAILRHITDARDESDDPGHKRRAAELVEIVADCIRRHTQLQSRLQSARTMFRAEQDRQQFAGPPQRASLDLHGQLLEPVLGLFITEAVNPLEQFFSAASGVDSPDALSLASLVSTLLRPVADRDRTAGPVVEPVLDEAPDDLRFTDEHRELTDMLLALPGQVRTLSSILREAAEFDDDLPALVALRAVHGYSPALGAAVRHGHGRMLIAVPADRPIEPSDAGVTGDDLLLTTADVVVPADDPDDAEAS
ncbi:hypothetical protein [Amycolatopsis aidingensis]|uniref:hypothetical protein n=1 Tax=Amycolatopsis aidingensis TaxID=2842453 RepID=UPI001E4C60AD|nr:hypothetical protein [Amycolatopsis aidingensis]